MNNSDKKLRSPIQKFFDFVTFPIRAVTLFFKDKFGLSSLATERFDYVAKEVKGHCLDVGCGRGNEFITKFLKGKGVGVDVYQYEGLTKENIVEDLTKFPYNDETFESVTFIANVNHIPEPQRDAELKEAHRCLKPNGNVIVTMGNPLAEIMVHKVVHFYDHHLGTNVDMDTERGMHHDEDYYLTDKEIRDRLTKAGFSNIQKKFFLTQWGFNHLFVGWKN